MTGAACRRLTGLYVSTSRAVKAGPAVKSVSGRPTSQPAPVRRPDTPAGLLPEAVEGYQIEPFRRFRPQLPQHGRDLSAVIAAVIGEVLHHFDESVFRRLAVQHHVVIDTSQPLLLLSRHEPADAVFELPPRLTDGARSGKASGESSGRGEAPGQPRPQL